MLDIRHLVHYKLSSTAVFLGSGQSINDITSTEWQAIRACDIWTVNNWIYHPVIIPHFYHIEVKYYNYELMYRRIREKLVEYRNVKFIFPRNKIIGLRDGSRPFLHEVVPSGPLKFDYMTVKRDSKRTDNPFHAKYKMNGTLLTKSYDMSITAVFELMFKMGYEQIITFGIDLQNSYYFWTGGNSKYGEVHHQTNKAHEDKDPEEPHATHRVKDFLIDFHGHWMKNKKHPRIGLFVGHKTTALYPEIQYKSVLEIR